MHTRLLRFLVAASLVALPVLSPSSLAVAEEPARLIVKCPRPCAAVVGTVAALGGETTQTYDNVDAVAVSMPRSRVADLTVALGIDAVRKDVLVSRPPASPLEAGSFIEARDLRGAAVTEVTATPANYLLNNALTNAAPLHAANVQGQGIIVAVIDSGTALLTPSLGPAANPTVIGGENLVPAAEDPVTSATSRLNDWHGTAVANMIAAHSTFSFATASTLVTAVRQHAPGSAIDCPTPLVPACPAGTSLIPMLGSAPAAKVYALKVFPSQGGGAPESRVIAAMDRAITLRRRFNERGASAPVAGSGSENSPFRFDALDIQVVNMSLGGPTLHAGRDIQDQLTLAMLEVGITLVTSAGNAGFAAMTGGSPGTGIGALTTAASSTAAHERILRDLQFGPGGGAVYRPFGGVQTAVFSSRGPTADGRFDPDLSANGLASYVNVFAATNTGGAIVSCGDPTAPASGPGACAPRILFVSGTSFSSPTVAGAAALLRQAVPQASALQVRNALVEGANRTLIADGSGRVDQGAGFLDVANALALLEANAVADRLPSRERDDDRDDGPDDVGAGGKSVLGNLKRLGIQPVRFAHDRYTTRVENLLPGQVAHFFIPSDMFTDRLVVRITEVEPELPPEQQNAAFGDDLFVIGVDAPTSMAVHRIESEPGAPGAFVAGDTTFTIDNPQTGIVRLALQGDTTNAGRTSARLTIERRRRPPTLPAVAGRIRQGDLIPYSIDVPPSAEGDRTVLAAELGTLSDQRSRHGGDRPERSVAARRRRHPARVVGQQPGAGGDCESGSGTVDGACRRLCRAAARPPRRAR